MCVKRESKKRKIVNKSTIWAEISERRLNTAVPSWITLCVLQSLSTAMETTLTDRLFRVSGLWRWDCNRSTSVLSLWRVQETLTDQDVLNLWPMREEAITDTESWVSSFEAWTDVTTFWASSLLGKRSSTFRLQSLRPARQQQMQHILSFRPRETKRINPILGL